MQDTFSLSEYLRYLSSRRRWLATAAVAAIAAALAISLMLPSQYTAVARLLVEPPASADARAPQVVTPQYLESLRSFESLATSDSLFERAISHFELRRRKPGRSIEAWKKNTLSARFVRNTKVLEIAVTLPDARMAHQMALFLAKGAIDASRELHRDADQELIGEAEKEFTAARKAFDEVEAQWSRALGTENRDTLESEIYSHELRQNRIDRRLLDAQVNKTGASASPAGGSVALLAAERDAVARTLAQFQKRLAAYKEKLRPIKENRKASLARLEGARKRVDDARGMAGYRGERLRMLDPGIVPERASSPNIPLNVIGAALFALVLALLYFSLRFGAAGDSA